MFGGKYHSLLVRRSGTETALGTPLSVWCLGRLCPWPRIVHSEIIGLGKSAGLQ